MSLIQQNLFQLLDYHGKELKVKLDTDIEMLLVAEKGIRAGICHYVC